MVRSTVSKVLPLFFMLIGMTVQAAFVSRTESPVSTATSSLSENEVSVEKTKEIAKASSNDLSTQRSWATVAAHGHTISSAAKKLQLTRKQAYQQKNGATKNQPPSLDSTQRGTSPDNRDFLPGVLSIPVPHRNFTEQTRGENSGISGNGLLTEKVLTPSEIDLQDGGALQEEKSHGPSVEENSLSTMLCDKSPAKSSCSSSAVSEEKLTSPDDCSPSLEVSIQDRITEAEWVRRTVSLPDNIMPPHHSETRTNDPHYEQDPGGAFQKLTEPASLRNSSEQPKASSSLATTSLEEDTVDDDSQASSEATSSTAVPKTWAAITAAQAHLPVTVARFTSRLAFSVSKKSIKTPVNIEAPTVSREITSKVWRLVFSGQCSALRDYLEEDRSLVHCIICNDGSRPLHVASQQGDRHVVKLLLDYGAEVDVRDFVGRTPLWRAVGEGHEACVKELLKGGAQVSITNKNNQTLFAWCGSRGHERCKDLLIVAAGKVATSSTPESIPTGIIAELRKILYKAAHTGQLAIMRELLESNRALANFDTNDNGARPLHWACGDGHLAVSRLLLESGADVNAQDLDGRTALSFAVFKGNYDMVELLSHHGANINLADKRGKSPLHWALEHPRVVKFLLDKGASGTHKDLEGKNPLQWAAGLGYLGSLRHLLDAGALRDTAYCEERDNEGRTALWWAAGVGHEECVSELLEWGAQVNIKDRKGQSILSWCSFRNHQKCTELLMKATANVSQCDDQGKYPLHWAAQNGANVGLILKAEQAPDVNAVDNSGSSALSWAAYFGSVHSVSQLLEAGARADLEDKEGKTALILAASEGHEVVVSLLLPHTTVEDQNEACIRAAGAGHLSVLNLFVAKKCSIQASSPSVGSGVSLSIDEKDRLLLELYMRYFDTASMADSKGFTLFADAVISGQVTLVRLLITLGNVDINAVGTARKRTAAHWAVRMAKGSLKKKAKQNSIGVTVGIIVALVQAGANPMIIDDEGYSPLRWVRRISYFAEHEKYLLEQALMLKSLCPKVKEEFKNTLRYWVNKELVVAKAQKKRALIRQLEEVLKVVAEI